MEGALAWLPDAADGCTDDAEYCVAVADDMDGLAVDIRGATVVADLPYDSARVR